MSGIASVDTLWYLARGSGVVTLVLFSVVVALGIVNRSGRPFLRLNELVVASVHRSASLLALAFLAVHIVTLLLDPYAQLQLVDLVVPFGAEYRPLWVGLGTLALDLAVAVVVTSLLRERIGLRLWKAVHWLAYAMWPVALLHGIQSGSDRATVWMVGVDIACAWLVLVVFVLRYPLRTLDRSPVPPVSPVPPEVEAGRAGGRRRAEAR